MKNRHTPYQEIITQLERLASEEFQRREWTQNAEKTWFFPEEIASMWIDDGMRQDPQWLVRSGEITPEILNILLPVNKAMHDFIDAFEKHGSDVYGKDLLTFSPWIELREKAQKALDEIEKNK